MAPFNPITHFGLSDDDFPINQQVIDEINEAVSSPAGLPGVPACLLAFGITDDDIQAASQSGPNNNIQGASQTGLNNNVQGASQSGLNNNTQGPPQSGLNNNIQGASQSGLNNSDDGSLRSELSNYFQGATQPGPNNNTHGASQGGFDNNDVEAAFQGGLDMFKGPFQYGLYNKFQGPSQSGHNNNIQGASQSGSAQYVTRPRAATTMNPIEEEAIETASMSDEDSIIGGQHDYHGEASLPEQCPKSHIHRAAVTARSTERSDMETDLDFLIRLGDDILPRSESLIANAAQHEHNQDVPACTKDHHNKNCGSVMDIALMEYYYLRSKGVIPERPYEHWGCDTPIKKATIEYYEKCTARVAFRPVNWQSGYTGRGSTKKSMKEPDDIGPRNEVEPTNASPLQIQRPRRQAPKVFQCDQEEGYGPHRPGFLNDDVAGYSAEYFAEGLDGQDTSTQRRSFLLAATARAALKLLEKESGHDHNQTTSPNPATGTSETTCSQGNKRRRNDSEDSACVPRSKRSKTAERNTEQVLGLNETGLSQHPHNIGPSGRVRALLNTLTAITTGAAAYDGKVVKIEPNSAEDINVRPTYAEEDSAQEGNEADEIVVMDIETVSTDSIRLVSQAPKQWTDEEKENLRLWVQDYGIANWKRIAWCLKCSEAECKLMACYIIMDLNMRAGRHIYAGMREDLLSVSLSLASPSPSPSPSPTPTPSATPSASPSPTPSASASGSASASRSGSASPSASAPPSASPSPSPTPSPTMTTRSLRPRTRHAAPRFQCGEIAYDTRARSLPKLEKNGNVVDNKGNVIVAWPRGGALASKVLQPRSQAGQKSRLTGGHQMENEPGNAPMIDTRTRVVKSYGGGAWRYGASRRAGNRGH